MWWTAIHLRKGPGLGASVVYGTAETVAGNVALFAPNRIVAYQIESAAQTLTLVFRTMAGGAPCGARIPGVRPRAELLVEARGIRAAARVKSLFRHLTKSAIAPESLSGGFWVRFDAVLNGRLRSGEPNLQSLLRHESAAA